MLTPRSTISTKALLSLYAILPIVWLLMLVDYLTNHSLMFALPNRPEFWWIWIYIFGMPHVFASYLLLADNEYLDTYKDKLIKGAIVLLALPPLIMMTAGYAWLFFIFTAMIIYHTISQQYGLSLVMAKIRPDRTHKAITIIGSSIGVLLYTLIYADQSVASLITPYSNWIDVIVLSFAALLTGLTMLQIKKSQTVIGKWYILSTLLMVLTMIGLFYYGLQVLAVIVGRIIHEFSAWIIYSAHDKARNEKIIHNLIYAKLQWLRIDTYYMGILLAFVAGVSVTYVSQENQDFLALLIVSFSLYHYWLEGVIWKGKSLPKQHLRFL
jgi:hypothetical protein